MVHFLLLISHFNIIPLATVCALLVAVGYRKLAPWQHDGPTVDLVEGFGNNRRAVGTNGGANGHEKAKRGCRSYHVLPQRAQHSIRPRAKADNVGEAKDEANNQADGSTHHAAHLELVES